MFGINFVISPREKLLQVAQQLGITDLSLMQATTGAFFDTLPNGGTGNQVFDFYTQANSRQWPDNNLESNKLPAGEALAVQAICFYIIEAGGTVVDTVALNAVLDFEIGNSIVLKNQKVGNGQIPNLGTVKPVNQVLYLKTPLVIPPQIEFSAQVQLQNTYSEVTYPRVGLYIYGTRVLLNFNGTI